MSRADTFTNTAEDAGRYEQQTAYEEDLREHDEPTGPIERTHQCDDPTCQQLLCVLDRVVAEQKAAGYR